MHHQTFSIHLKNIYSDKLQTYFQQNVFERGTMVPGHSQFSLEATELCQLQLSTTYRNSTSKLSDQAFTPSYNWITSKQQQSRLCTDFKKAEIYCPFHLPLWHFFHVAGQSFIPEVEVNWTLDFGYNFFGSGHWWSKCHLWWIKFNVQFLCWPKEYKESNYVLNKQTTLKQGSEL